MCVGCEEGTCVGCEEGTCVWGVRRIQVCGV